MDVVDFFANMIDEKDLSALINIAHLARRCKFYVLSERMFQHFNHAYPLRAFPHVGLGLIFFERGRHIQACLEFERAIELGDKNKDLYFHYGASQFICGNYKACVRALKTVIDMDREDGESDAGNLAKILLERRELSRLHP